MNGNRRIKAVWAGLLAFTVAGAVPAEDLKEAAKKPPKEPEAALSLGRSLRQAGLYDDSLKVLRGAALRAKGPLAVAARTEAARTLISWNRQKDALRECQTLKALDGVRWETCVAEAHLLWKRASLALPAAERALEKSSDDYDALVAKGRAQRMLGKDSESEAAFKAAIAKDGARYEAHRYYAELLSGMNKGAEAILSLRKAVGAAPEEPEPLLALAEALPAGPEAVTLLEKALKIRPKYGAAHARLGNVLLEQGKVAEAETALRAAIAIDAKVADWQAGLALALVAKGTYDEALKVSATALKLVGNHALAKLAEADAIAGKGDIDLAIEAYEKAASFSRDNPLPLLHAAQACLAQNRPTTARAFADRATQSFADFGPGWVLLGDVAAAAKDRAVAKSAYQKALVAAKGNVDKASVKKKLAALK
ncbi:MAG: tetratricopeptide repeat protein [Polyangiaceae bacterium]|nr:tetratricopeptide repeat protein [Polyangiaceae bacterium]MCE7893534.1 hypothetical protein [Sorangiineae bacterium PRO1]MCL4748979.1 tetratricopeptide repeat protein [Myxococcales bacterium]